MVFEGTRKKLRMYLRSFADDITEVDFILLVKHRGFFARAQQAAP